MPLLKGSKNINIIIKDKKIKCILYYETEKRIGFLIDDESIENLKKEIRLDFELLQGNYECSFQSKIDFIEYDFVNNKYLLQIEFPPVLRRTLKIYK